MSGVNHMISAEDIKTLKKNVKELMDAQNHGAVTEQPAWHKDIAQRMVLEVYDNLNPLLTTLLNILDKPVSDIAGNVSKEVVLDERIEEDYDDDL